LSSCDIFNLLRQEKSISKYLNKSRNINVIQKLLVGNSISYNPGLISNSILHFDKDLYDEKPSIISQDQISIMVYNCIPHIFSQFDNHLMTKIPDYLEIKFVAFALNMDYSLSWGIFLS